MGGPMFEIPAAAGGDAGLEGFHVEGAAGPRGRVAAVNRSAQGLVLVVVASDGFRAVPVSAVAGVERLAHVVRLTPAGEAALATAPTVTVEVAGGASTTLVRHLPVELDAVTVDGVPPPRARTGGVYAAATLTVVGGVGAFVTGPLIFVGWSWLWLAAPLALFALGLALLWRGYARTTDLTGRARIANAFAALLGVSPPTRRR
jgi:hypothetical protein